MIEVIGLFGGVMLVIFAFVMGLWWWAEYGDRVMDRVLPERIEDPEKLLQRRYAKGEIDEAEYSRRLSVLRLGPPLELPD